MHRAAFERLPDADRKIVLDEGRKAAERWQRESARLAAEEEKALLAKGMEITYMGDAQRAKLKQVWSDGLWESAMRAPKTRKDIEELRAFAKAKGLAD
jgi:TRAP-type C4-dicarboxylate transport system substrate-binding protein